MGPGAASRAQQGGCARGAKPLNSLHPQTGVTPHIDFGTMCAKQNRSDNIDSTPVIIPVAAW